MATTLKLIGAMIVVSQLIAATFARASDDHVPCFDVSVKAIIADEVPSNYSDCGSDCIIISWPWFVDLKIRSVLQGELKDKELSVLAVMHTRHSNAGKRAQTRWLRRNSEGGFNLLRLGDDDRPEQCSPDTPPMRAYLIPTEGRTLADERREGEKRYKNVSR